MPLLSFTQMKIKYQALEGNKEFYVALDALDLEILHEEVVNALEKSSVIESMLKNAGINYVEP